MLNNKSYYFDFVTDLRRAVYCLTNNNLSSAKTFLKEADKLFEVKLKKNGDHLCFDLYSSWKSIYKKPIPLNRKKQRQLSDTILTLSSKIFLRTFYAKH